MHSASHAPYHVRFLNDELSRRKNRNPRYSLRAFAQFLKLDPAALSRINNGKQELSLQACLNIVQKLNLLGDDKQRFLDSVASEKLKRATFLLGSNSSEKQEVIKSTSPVRISKWSNEIASSSTVELESILALSPDLIFVTDREERFLFANSSAAKVAGLKPSDVIGRTGQDLGFPEGIIKLLHSQYAQVLSRGEPCRTEANLPCKAVPVCFELITTPLFESEGEVRAYITMARDITLQKQSENRVASLLALTSELSKAARTTEVAAIVLKHATSVLGANAAVVTSLNWKKRRFEKLLAQGYSESTLHILETMSFDDAFPMSQMVRTGKPVFLESLAEKQVDFPEFHKLMKAEGTLATATLPLNGRNRIIGGMALRFPTERTFSAAEESWLMTIANQCAQALERAQLYQDHIETSVQNVLPFRKSSYLETILSSTARHPAIY